MRRLRPLLAVGLVWGLSFPGLPSARAQEAPVEARPESPATPEPAGYRALVEEALVEYDAGHYEESRALLRRAHGLFPNARSYRGLGMASFELRDYATAIHELQASLASTVRPLDEKLRAATEQLLARARGFVGAVLVQVQPTAARLSIDSVPVEQDARAPILLSVGDHRLVAEAAGYLPEQRMLKIQGGESEQVHLVLRELPALAQGAGPRDEPRRWYKNPWLWTAAAVGLAAIAGTTFALTRGEESETPAHGGSSAVTGQAL